MPFRIIRDDISRVRADAIVCSANPQPEVGGGGEAAIHEAAGPGLLRARKRLGKLEPGAAVATKAYNLPARYVIHTVGPVWKDGKSGETETLHQCYCNAICTALSLRCNSVAFPLISSGSFGFSKSDALHVALSEFQRFAEEDMELILVVYDKEAYHLSEERFADVAAYIDDHYLQIHPPQRGRGRQGLDRDAAWLSFHGPEEDMSPLQAPSPHSPGPFGDEAREDVEESLPGAAPLSEPYFDAASETSAFLADRQSRSAEQDMPQATIRLQEEENPSLEERMRKLDAGFSETLLHLIDESGCSDVEIYKRANISRKLFSKIRSSPNYQPSKPTALAFCVALHLDPTAARELIGRAGYALSRSSRFDVIVEYFLEMGKYDIFEINEALFSFDQPLLGSA